MSRDKDLELARKLQAQFDEEAAQEVAENMGYSSAQKDPEFGGGLADYADFENSQGFSMKLEAISPMSIVDEKWELLDPNPDMRAMFLEFNDKYFWGRLAGVEVRWSPRMTLCAGLCCYEGRGGLCSIRLSSPLLKLRPRKDLVETLLHEMIHAYLFVTANNKDHDSHGPEFCKHMNRLNKLTGTNISIYHNFHDEVDVYRQHWWRCNGPCQKRPPYYGMVRRAMNRAPSPRDPWWAEHQRTCGGSYTKVKEPEGYGVKKGTKRKKEDTEENSENETKKRATDIPSLFPGKGFTVGGTSTTSRLVPPKTATLENFLKKVERPKVPSTAPSPSSSSRSQDVDEEADCGQDNRSRNSRRAALIAIFDSDDSEDEDVVIVKVDKPLKQNNGYNEDDIPDSVSKPGTSQSSHHLVTKTRNSNSSNSASTEHTSISKPKQTNQSDLLSKPKSGIAATSHSNNEDHGKKQESIIDAFSRIRQRSGDLGRVDGKRINDGVSPVRTGQDTHDAGSVRSNASASDAVISGVRDEQRRQSNPGMVDCPVCGCKVEQSRINEHLDQCLS